jgi:hypothetical protein
MRRMWRRRSVGLEGTRFFAADLREGLSQQTSDGGAETDESGEVECSLSGGAVFGAMKSRCRDEVLGRVDTRAC